LARQPEVGSRARAKELIDSGLVRLAGQRVKAGLFLAAGQTVQFSAPPEAPAAPPPPAKELPVLFADHWLIAIDKPPGLAAHPPEGRSRRGHSVASLARTQFGELPVIAGDDRPGIVHRLDRET